MKKLGHIFLSPLVREGLLPIEVRVFNNCLKQIMNGDEGSFDMAQDVQTLIYTKLGVWKNEIDF